MEALEGFKMRSARLHIGVFYEFFKLNNIFWFSYIFNFVRTGSML